MSANKTFTQRVNYYKFIVKRYLNELKQSAQRYNKCRTIDERAAYNYYTNCYDVQLKIFAVAMGVSERYLERYI